MQELSSIQKAYGLLWRTVTDSLIVNEARKELFGILSKDERRAGIAWAIEVHGPITTHEMIAADMRAGVFPEKSV